jgi:diguanylate cyclase (GGDEF)-like protein
MLRAGVQAIAVQPLSLSGVLIGLLTTADTRLVEHDPTIGAAVELLAAQTAASLGMASAIEKLSTQATQDPLTRLRNAGAFVDDMARAASRGSTACLMIDVDHFKTVNDTYGHLVGDQLLCDLADHLRAHLRGADMLYRVGGDEFAAILPDTNAETAELVARRLLDAARDVRTTVSIGWAMLGGAGPDSARTSADKALYEAKERGRNRVEPASP